MVPGQLCLGFEANPGCAKKTTHLCLCSHYTQGHLYFFHLENVILYAAFSVQKPWLNDSMCWGPKTRLGEKWVCWWKNSWRRKLAVGPPSLLPPTFGKCLQLPLLSFLLFGTILFFGGAFLPCYLQKPVINPLWFPKHRTINNPIAH